MEVVDKLSDVCHRDLVCVTVECIERQSCYQGIAECRGLAEEMRAGDLRSGPMPGAPFVYNELHALVAIAFCPDSPMPLIEILHLHCFAKQPVPIGRSEIDRISFSGRTAIIMQRPSIQQV